MGGEPSRDADRLKLTKAWVATARSTAAAYAAAIGADWALA
jgi:hypothetical protein